MITVGFSTYDRQEALETNLRDLGKQDLRGLPDVELLVVLNNSPRETREIVDRVLPELPYKCRKIEEPSPGLNFARNRIRQEASGDIIVYTDDDLTRDPNWLREMVRGFDDPTVDCVGGRILPNFLCRAPDWLNDPSYNGIIVKYDLGDEPRMLNDGDVLPFGASMAFRRRVLDTVGPFRTDITLRPNTYLSADETEYLMRAVQYGFRIMYCADAVCYHPIDEDRLDKEYVRKRFRGLGVAWARIRFDAESAYPSIAGVPRHLYRLMIAEAFRWSGAFLLLNRSASFLHGNRFIFYSEMAKEVRRIRKEKNS